MPLKSAGRLEITTRIGCSINCVFCPQKLLVTRYCETSEGKPVTEMSLDVFKRCIDKLPLETRIDFSGMAEPWLNKDCTEMVRYAAKRGNPIAVYTTMVGMTQHDLDALCEIPLEEFVLHIPDDKSNSHINVTPEYIALLERAVTEKRGDEPIVTGFSCHAGLHPDIAAALPPNSKLITEMCDRAGNLSNDAAEGANPQGDIVCIQCEADVNHNVLLPDGRVVLCCMDYGMQHVLGNLLELSWEELHETEEAKRVVKGMSDASLGTLCRKCVNAKNIHEVYSELRLYRDWVKNLQSSEKQHMHDLKAYQQWVSNLEHTGEQARGEIETLLKKADELNAEKNSLEEKCSRLEKQWSNTEEKCACLEAANRALRENYDAMTAQRDAARESLHAIESSRAYRALTVYKKIRNRD